MKGSDGKDSMDKNKGILSGERVLTVGENMSRNMEKEENTGQEHQNREKGIG